MGGLMRPKNLKYPFSWEQRKPIFYEGVLFVPKYYEKHKDYCLQSVIKFKGPFFIEYCSGNGDWIIEQAQMNKDYFWIAVEKQFDRVRKIWSKMHNHKVKNLLIVCADALTFTKEYLWKGAAQEIFVNFPDPWPKQRHAKNRLIQEPFINAITEIIRRGGKAVYTTDHYPYVCQMIEEMQRNCAWQSVFPKPFFTQVWKGYGRSWFADLFEKKGKQIYFTHYQAI